VASARVREAFEQRLGVLNAGQGSAGRIMRLVLETEPPDDRQRGIDGQAVGQPARGIAQARCFGCGTVPGTRRAARDPVEGPNGG